MGTRTCESAWQLGCRCNYQSSCCSVSLSIVWTKSVQRYWCPWIRNLGFH